MSWSRGDQATPACGARAKWCDARRDGRRRTRPRFSGRRNAWDAGSNPAVVFYGYSKMRRDQRHPRTSRCRSTRLCSTSTVTSAATRS